MKGRFWAMTLLTAVAAVGFAFGAGAAENIRAYYVLGVQDTSLKMDESRLSPSSWPLTGIGSSKTFTATPPAGYNVSEWLWKGATTLSTLDMDVIAGDVPTYTVNYSGEGSRTLGVRFEYIPLTVSFKANGGSGQSMASIPDKNIDSSFTLDSNQFTRPGYSFAGWTNTLGTAFADGASVTGASFWDGSSWSFKSDLYAVWTQSVYTVTFDANGGSTPTPSMPVTYGETYGTLPTPTWTGHSFDGWYTDSTGGSKVTGDSAVLIVADQTLYARWSEMYIVTFQYRDFNGNPASVDSPYIKRGESTNPPASDVVDQWRGHRFTGWEGSYENVTANRAVSAKYEAVKYTVKYDRNCGDATGDMADSQSRDYGVSWDLPQNQFVRPGYEFREWTTKADGSGSKYGDGASVSDLSSEDGATVTLYAQWTPITYWIEFNGGTGSSGSMATTNVEYGAEVVLPSNKFTKPGCVFQGWECCSELFFLDGATVSNLTTVADATVTLVAMWDAPYWVAFDSNGGAGEMAVQRFEVGEEKALSPNEFSRTGYTFGGWATNAAEAAALTVKYVDGAVVSNLTDKVETNTLYAVWNTNAYYVAFDPNGGTGGPMEPQKFFYDQAQALAANAYSFADHWVLVGWSNVVNGAVYAPGAEVVNLCTEANATNTLFAVWQFVPSDYSVALDCGNPGDMYFEANENSGWTVTASDYYLAPSSIYQEGKWDSSFEWLTATITNEAASARRGTLSFWWAGDIVAGFGSQAQVAKLSFACDGQVITNVATTGMVSGGHVQTWSNVVQTVVIPAGASIDISFANTSDGNEKPTVWLDNVEWTWNYDGDEKYTVVYSSNCVDSTGVMTNQTRHCGETWNLGMNEFVREGYVFAGWNTESGGGGTSYEDGAEVIDLSYEDGATVVLYAQWTPTEDPGGGGGGYPSVYSEALDCDNLYFEADEYSGWNVSYFDYHCGASSMCQVGTGTSNPGETAWLTASITNKSGLARQGTLSFWWAGDSKMSGFKYQYAKLSFAYGGQADIYEATAGMVSGGQVQVWSNVVQVIEVPAGGSVDVSFANVSGSEGRTVWVDNVTWTWDGEGGVEPGPEDARDISSVTFDGGVMSLSFTNADERFSYNLRGTNDLVAPLALWPVLWTTNGTGNITITPPHVPSAPQFFYYLETISR